MNSEKSSLSLFWLTFRSAVKGNFILPLLNLTVLIITFPLSSVNSNRGNPEITVKETPDFYKYLIFHTYDQISNNVIAHISIIAFSILLAIMLFRFFSNKKTIDVYYSLGMTRKNLFISKYFAGVLMLFISILIPFSVSLIINISEFGYSPELLSAITFLIVGYCTLAATAFGLAIAVFSCVGTIVEGIAYTGIIILVPTLVYKCIPMLMNKLTLGSPFNNYYYKNAQTTDSFASTFSKINPINFFFNNAANIGSLFREKVMDKYEWTAPDYKIIIIWIIIAIALFALGMVIFQIRKVEICGFLGVNKWLSYTATFIAGFYPFCLAISKIDSLIAGIVVGTAIYTSVYMLIDFFLLRTRKEWVNGLIKLPVHLGVVLLIVLVFVTGVFGYSSRIPKIETVESAEITPASYLCKVDSNDILDGDFDFGYLILGPINDLKSKKDINIVENIHSLLVKDGKLKITQKGKYANHTSILIIYHLKNGKTIFRYYNKATAKIITAMLSIYETDVFKKTTVGYLNKSDIFLSNTSQIFMLPNRLNVENRLDITPKQRVELLKALAKDFSAQTVNERFFPKSPVLGIIKLSSTPRPEYGYDFFPPEVGELWQDQEELNALKINITDDMVNTIKLLKSNDLFKYFNNGSDSNFVSVRIIPSIKFKYNYNNIDTNMPYSFFGGWNRSIDKPCDFNGAYTITNKALVDEIAANSSIYYFNTGTGYFVQFKLADNGGYTTMFVPASNMPQSVIDGVAALNKN